MNKLVLLVALALAACAQPGAPPQSTAAGLYGAAQACARGRALFRSRQAGRRRGERGGVGGVPGRHGHAAFPGRAERARRRGPGARPSGAASCAKRTKLLVVVVLRCARAPGQAARHHRRLQRAFRPAQRVPQPAAGLRRPLINPGMTPASLGIGSPRPGTGLDFAQSLSPRRHKPMAKDVKARKSAALATPTDLGANATKDLAGGAQHPAGRRLCPLPQDQELPLARVGAAFSRLPPAARRPGDRDRRHDRRHRRAGAQARRHDDPLDRPHQAPAAGARQRRRLRHAARHAGRAARRQHPAHQAHAHRSTKCATSTTTSPPPA